MRTRGGDRGSAGWRLVGWQVWLREVHDITSLLELRTLLRLGRHVSRGLESGAVRLQPVQHGETDVAKALAASGSRRDQSGVGGRRKGPPIHPRTHSPQVGPWVPPEGDPPPERVRTAPYRSQGSVALRRPESLGAEHDLPVGRIGPAGTDEDVPPRAAST